MGVTGFTTNPTILLRDQVPECSIRCLKVLANQVCHQSLSFKVLYLCYNTVHIQHRPGLLHLPSSSKQGCLAAQAWDLGAQELQLQAWGDSAGRLFSVGLDLAAIDAARIVVKLPVTAEGVEAAAYLKDRNVRVTLTGTRAPQAWALCKRFANI